MQRTKYKWKLPASIKERLSDHSYGHQRIIHEGDHLMIILHAVPAEGQRQRSEEVFFKCPEKNWMHNGMSNGDKSIFQVLREYQTLYFELEDQYENAESSKHLHKLIARANPVARAAKNMAETLQAARKAHPEERFLLGARDQATELARNFEILLEEARLSLDHLIAERAGVQISEQRKIAKSQHKLNIIAALTFPLMAITSFFGMSLNKQTDLNLVAFFVILVFSITVGFNVKSWVTGDNKDNKDDFPKR